MRRHFLIHNRETVPRDFLFRLSLWYLDNYVDGPLAFHDNRPIRFNLPQVVGISLCNRVECWRNNAICNIEPAALFAAQSSSQNDAGAVPADLPIERLTLVLARPLQVEQAYTQFLKDQQDPGSSEYHHWLTPAQIGKRFGVSAHDIHAVTVWLQSQNLHVDAVSNSRQRITFSGPASAVGNAFAAEMRYFTVNGEKRISINAEPKIPAALAAVIKSVSGLYTVKLYPQHGAETVQVPAHNIASNWRTSVVPDGTFCSGSVCQNVIFPADFATIYNLIGVTGGFTGAGQTIAIIGRSRVCTADITNFATQAAVTANVPTAIVPPLGIDPGAASCSTSTPPSGDQSEATLDVTRSGSIAQGAALDLVISADSQTVDGIGVAATFVVDTPPASAPKIMSISFGGAKINPAVKAKFSFGTAFSSRLRERVSRFLSHPVILLRPVVILPS
jgi:subtilase family serine protease